MKSVNDSNATPEQEFWCRRFEMYMQSGTAGVEELTIAREFALKAADADLAEFRKRFGEVEKVANDAPTSTYLYPWDKVPDKYHFCTVNSNRELWAHTAKPKHGEISWYCRGDDYSMLIAHNFPTPDWRTSLEERPEEFRK